MPTVKPPSSTPPNSVYLKKKRALATTKPKKRAIPVGMHGVGAAPAAQVLPCMKLPGFEGMVSGIFDDADTNNDGKVDISEAYILILKLYININRQAPIAPPSRATADLLFRTSDNDDSGKLSKQEFTELASKLFGRAGLRVASYKIITVLVAPLLGALLRFVASCVPFAEEGSPRRAPRAGDAAMADEAAADDSAAAADVAAVEEGIESLRLAPVAAQTLDVLIRSPVCEASLKRCAAELAAEAAAAEAPASPSRLGAAVPSFAQASGRLARALG